jgi:hypothetical protein
MGKKGFWYGYLEAGKKSSGVLLDFELDTGNRKTLYLFNLLRSRILEYDRQHVEPRLRQLTDEETDLIAEMDAAYVPVKANFLVSHENHPVNLPESAPRSDQGSVKYSAASTPSDVFDEEFDDELGKGGSVQPIFALVPLVDTRHLASPHRPLNRWGMHLLQDLPVTLNAHQNLDTGQAGLELRGTPSKVGQRTLEMQKADRTPGRKRR